MFADCFGFGNVFADTREIPIANPSLSYAQIKSLGFTDDEIETHRKAYQFLRSALTSEVDRGILLHAHSPAEAWANLQTWHNLSPPRPFPNILYEARLKPLNCPHWFGRNGS